MTSKRIIIIIAIIFGFLIVIAALPWIIDPEGSKAIVKRNKEEKEYFRDITQNAEIIVNFTNSKGKDVELYWSLIKGTVDDYQTDYFPLWYSPVYDMRLIKLIEIESSGFIFESPKNKPSSGGKDYYSEVELEFDPPKDLTQKEYFTNGTIYIIGRNNRTDKNLKAVGDTKESYDANFEIYNYAVSKTTTTKRTKNTNPDDVINEMKNILDEKTSEKEQLNDTEIKDGKYCFQLDNLSNNGSFYYAEITIQNSQVLGKLTVEYESSDGYSATFLGNIEADILKVKVSYDNDAEGPYEEKWEINQNSLILEQPSIHLTRTTCN